MEDNVTQGQLNSQLLLLHGVMKDSNDRNHQDTVKILDQITNIAKESRDTRIEILTMTRENAVEIDNQSIIFPINNGLSIDFRFKKLEIKSWEDVKDRRIGRILSPHIDRMQQRYAAYLQRQGLPRVPQKAIF